MNKTALLNSMVERYLEHSHVEMYKLGFELDGVIYNATVNHNELYKYVKLDKASRGAGYSVRFSPSKKMKIAMLPIAEVLCSKEYFDERFNGWKYNKGETHEAITTEFYGQKWEKDNERFDGHADLEVDGVGYELKFERGTFCNEKSLANLG